MKPLGRDVKGTRWFFDYSTNRIVAVTPTNIRQWAVSELLMHRYMIFPSLNVTRIHPMRLDKKLASEQDPLLFDAIGHAAEAKIIPLINGLTESEAEALKKVPVKRINT